MIDITELKAKLAGFDVVCTFTEGGVPWTWLLRRAHRDGVTKPWPYAKSGLGEWTVEGAPCLPGGHKNAARHPHLYVKASVRLYDDAIRVELAIENPWLDAVDLTYDLKITETPADPSGSHVSIVKLDRKAVTHGKWMRARQVIWIGTPHEEVAPFDLAALKASGLVPSYLDVPVASNVIDNFLSKWEQADRDGLSFDLGLWTEYEPSTGGRDELGLLPAWTAAALVSQDQRLLQAVVENDALFNFPIYVRDRATLKPISVATHPDLVLSQPDTPAGLTPRRWDLQHCPAAHWAGWILTGSPFFADGVAMHANWATLNRNATYREHGKGIMVGPHSAVRAEAWAMRSLALAAQLPEEVS